MKNAKARVKLFTGWEAIIIIAASLLCVGLLTGCPHKPNENPKISPAPAVQDKYIITIKGDERTAIQANAVIEIPIKENKVWSDIKAEAKRKAILGAEWRGGDYQVYEWRIDNEKGKLLADTELINKNLTVYAITNYVRFKIENGKISETKGYKGNKPRGKIIIPKNISGIGKKAFAGCEDLTSVDLSGCTNLGKIERLAFHGCKKLKTADLSGCTNITEICENVFSDCDKLETVNLSGCTRLTKIGAMIFWKCDSLTSLDLSDCMSLSTLEDFIFSDSKNLKNVRLPPNLTKIGDAAFSACESLTSINLPAKLSEIGVAAFAGCPSLTSLTVESGNTTYKSIDNIVYTQDGTTIIAAAGGLSTVSIPAAITKINGNVFDGSKLKKIDLSGCAGLTEIGISVFKDCTGLTEVKLPVNLNKISWCSFLNCKNLTSINLPASLIKIDREAFFGCTKLTSAVFADTANWAMYDKADYTGPRTPIPSDLDNSSKAAKYLNETYNKKYWKKN